MEIKSDHTDKVYSYLALRKAVGWIGILLPIVLVLGHLIIFDGESALTNMSVYYHTGMRDVFVGAICAIALFLFFTGVMTDGTTELLTWQVYAPLVWHFFPLWRKDHGIGWHGFISLLQPVSL